MCGINGIYNFKHQKDHLSDIDKMNSALAHRGPDDQGSYSEANIALGHRRLSIIDLSRVGHQPMWSNDHRYILVFNGEIYNFQNIKEHLSTKYNFKTKTDTEVILAAYQQWGTACLDQFNGMFAFAIWDTQKKELFIARDRLGIKPLYYYLTDEYFVFSSELRALLASNLVPRKISHTGLIDFLSYQTVHAPATILENVSMLLPGHYIHIKDNTSLTKQYWRLDKQQKTSMHSYKETTTNVRELLTQAVNRRMIADVPFGAFLSGGIDSSIIVGLMSQLVQQKVNTFSIVFGEEKYSEAKYAKIIAQKYQTNHHEIHLKPDHFLELLPDGLLAMDHPSGDGLNTYVVSKVTKNAGIDMALSGLGGDELFAGYDIFKRAKILNQYCWLNKIPEVLRHYLADLLFKKANSIGVKKIAKIFQGNLGINHYYPYNRTVLFEETIEEMMQQYEPHSNHVKSMLDESNTLAKLPLLSRISFAEMSSYMQNVLLRDTDQMSMAHALEVRVPFLDHELVAYVMGVPDQFKYPSSPKKLLVDAASDLLPKEIVNRPKMGFTLPWEQWLKKELYSFAKEKIESLSERSLFHSHYIQNLWSLFLQGDPYITWSRIWQLIVLESWLANNHIKS